MKLSAILPALLAASLMTGSLGAFADEHEDRDRHDDRDHHEARDPRDDHHRPDYVHHDDWRRGARMRDEDWRRGEHIDYREYHLRAPPRGYEWRRVDGNYVLAAVATGVIASVIVAAIEAH